MRGDDRAAECGRALLHAEHSVAAYDAGWKDTVDLRPAELASVLVRFTDYRGRYIMHCHNLEHEDMAMMAAINVT